MVGEIPSRSKCAWLRGSFTRAITFGTPYFSLAIWPTIMLSSSSPVSASTMSGGRAMPARSRTKSSVASPRCTWCSNSSSSCSKRSRLCSISVTSWPRRRSERVDVRADLAAAGDDDVHQPATSSVSGCGSGIAHVRAASISASMATLVGQTVSRPRSA